MESATSTRRPFVHRARWLVVLGTMATTVAVWALAVQATGQDLVVRQGGTTTTVDQLPVVLVSLAAGLAAWGLLAGLERVTRHARTVWLVIAVVVLLGSLAGPSAATTGTAVGVLLGLHLLVGTLLVVGLLVVAPRVARRMAERREDRRASAVR